MSLVRNQSPHLRGQLYQISLFALLLSNFLITVGGINPKTIYFPFADDSDLSKDSAIQEQSNNRNINLPKETNNARLQVNDVDSQIKNCESLKLEYKDISDKYEVCLSEKQKHKEEHKTLLEDTEKLCKPHLFEAKNNFNQYKACLSDGQKHVEKFNLLLAENNKLCSWYLDLLLEVVKHARKDAPFQTITFDFMLTETDLHEIQDMLNSKTCKNEIQILPILENWMSHEQKMVLTRLFSITYILFLLFLHAMVLKFFIIIYMYGTTKVISHCRNLQAQFTKTMLIFKHRTVAVPALEDRNNKTNILSETNSVLFHNTFMYKSNKVEAFSSKADADLDLNRTHVSVTEGTCVSSNECSSESCHKKTADEFKNIAVLGLNPEELRKKNK